MSGGYAYRHPNYRKFFFSELISGFELEDLLQEAYILVSKLSFTYSDVKTLTRTERVAFMKLYQEELEREANAVRTK